MRARIIQVGAFETTNAATAIELGFTNTIVGKRRSRFIAKGCAGLLDEVQCGVLHTNSEEVVTQTLDSRRSR